MKLHCLILPCAFLKFLFLMNLGLAQIYFLSMLPCYQTEMKAGEMEMTNGGEQGERPKFGPRPKFNSKNFDFKKELA